ncbi:MAG: tetratricopeptide repeat protein [Acidobacteria bacterium]|nr:tetratricopeptide repeat protein [Acidobacteriota bacterium]
MTYPGNASLPSEVRERVAQTFRHTVDLYRQGRNDEVRAGCDLMLKMDPLFDPAKGLIDKLDNPFSLVDVDELLTSLGTAETGAVGDARSAFAARDFRRVMELCGSILAADPSNAAARELGAAATEKLEAEPFVMQFVDQARNEIAAGRLDSAKAALDKASSLDDDHPAVAATIASLEAARSGGGIAPSFEAQPPAEAPSGFDFSSAFVVDSPAPSVPASGASASSTAQASDFGFTFEEEQKPAPPEAPIAPPAAFEPPPAASDSPFGGGGMTEFDFTTAAVDLSPDDASKIKQYLSEGDAAYGRQEFQKAIDLWSRIFLIDVTNDEASQRIELARKKRLEVDQQIDDLMVAGTLAFEKRDSATAREKFEDVLRLDPTHFNANEYIEKLNEMQAGPAVSEPARPAPAAAPPLDDIYDDGYESSEDTFAPPDSTAAAASVSRPKATPPTRHAKKGIPKIAIIGGAVALVAILAVAGWFMFTPKGPKFDPAATQSDFDRASTYATHGEFDRAIDVLKGINPADPLHNRALEMIDEYQGQKARARDKAAQADYDNRLAKAREAFGIKNFLEAKTQYESASAIKALPPEDQTNYQVATQQAAKLDAAQLLFKEGKYVEAIAALEQLLAEDPENVSVRLLLGNAHFNLGRSLLETEQLKQAGEEFSRALEFNPQDDLAQRSKDLAERYDGEPKDLLYRIYVRYLPIR